MIRKLLRSWFPPRILVVDDKEDFTLMLTCFLRRTGLHADGLTEPLEALKVIKSNPPDLIIVDQSMPGMTGIEMIVEARKQGFKAPAILCSGYECPDWLPPGTSYLDKGLTSFRPVAAAISSALKIDYAPIKGTGTGRTAEGSLREAPVG